MFCKNCGNEMKDTEKFCAVCGTPAEILPEQPATEDSARVNMEKVTEVASQAAEVASQAAETASQAAENVAKKAQELGEKAGEAWEKASGEGGVLTKLLSGKNKIWLIVCAVLIVVAIPCIANAARINNFLHKTFSSPAKYYQFVEKKALSEEVDLIGGYYSDYVSRQQLYDKSYSGEVTIEPGDDIQRLTKLADPYLEDMGIDLSELKSLKIGANVSVKDSVVGYGMTTAVNKINLLSVNAVMDMNQEEVYFQIPELTKTYIGVELEDYVDGADELMEFQEKSRELIKALPKQAVVEKMVNRYLTIILENVEDVSIGRKTELKVEGVTQKCTELKVTLDSDTMENILEAVLDEVQGDKTLEKIIVEVAEASDLDGDEVYEDFIEEIEDMLDDVEYMGDDEIKMTVYVDGKGNIIGRVFEKKDHWGKSSFSVLTASKGSNIAYEISYVLYGRDVMELSGKGKKSGNKVTGDFGLKADGKSALALKVNGLDIEKLKRGYINGKIEISLSSELSKELSNEIDVPAISSLIKKSSLLLDCESSLKSMDCKATLNYDGEKFLAVTLALKSGDGSRTSIPNSNSVIMVEDEDDFMDYLDEIDWNKFLSGLEKTGVFAETADVLEDVIDDLDDLDDVLRLFGGGSAQPSMPYGGYYGGYYY